MAAAGVAAIALTGCTARNGAGVAVGVDASGAQIGVMLVCQGHIDGVTIYRGSKDYAKWTAVGGAPAVSTWNFESGGHGWVVTKVPRLATEGEYTIYGWTKNNSWSAGGLDFTVAQLNQLRPGQVLYFGPDGKDAVTPLADFTAHGCEPNWGGPS
jgi:hypothetical protein